MRTVLLPMLALLLIGAAHAAAIPLGVYADSPAAYTSFVATMGMQPAYFLSFVDFHQPLSAWVSSANYGASVASTTPELAHATPVISLNLFSSHDTPDDDEKAFAAGAEDTMLDGIVSAYASRGFETQVFRLGWEMNIAGPTFYGAAPTDWVAAFQHVATVLRASAKMHGVTVQIVWNPAISAWEAAPTTSALWPGAAYVDIVGVDVYADAWPITLYDFSTRATDASIQTWSASVGNRVHYWSYPSAMWTSWAGMLSDATGGHSLTLQKLIAFARAQSKPIAIAETGAGNSGAGRGVQDDADWPAWLYDTLIASGTPVAFVNVWDSESGGDFALPNKPTEAAAWAHYFGAK